MEKVTYCKMSIFDRVCVYLDVATRERFYLKSIVSRFSNWLKCFLTIQAHIKLKRAQLLGSSEYGSFQASSFKSSKHPRTQKGSFLKRPGKLTLQSSPSPCLRQRDPPRLRPFYKRVQVF